MRTGGFSGLLALVVLFVLSLTSCGGFSEKAGEKMVEKYENGEITKDEIATCIDWVEEAQTESMEMMEDALDKSKNRRQFDRKMEESGEIFDEKWDGMEDVVDMLEQAAVDGDDTMGPANKKRWIKLRGKFEHKVMNLYEKSKKKFND